MTITAELISTGAELLNGRTLNRHGQVLGRILASRGIALVRDTTVSDTQADIAECVKQAIHRSDLVFVTGGLGPTNDDVTREGVAAALERPLEDDEETLQLLAAKYAEKDRPFTASRKRQARIIQGAKILPNPVGLAPGQLIELDECSLVMLPGPPREFLGLLHHQVEPWLDRFTSDNPLIEKIFMITGHGESDVLDVMESAGFPNQHVDVAYYSGPGQVELVLRSVDSHGLEQLARQVRTWFAGHIVAEQRVALEQVVAELFIQQGKSVAVAESCTGGLLGGRLTQLPGSSSYFRGGVIAYDNSVKQEVLGVPVPVLDEHGAVSGQVAEEMARQVRRQCGADIGISTTGIAGPEGGSAEKPVGLVYIGLANEQGAVHHQHLFTGDRGLVRERSVQAAMEVLRRALTQDRG